MAFISFTIVWLLFSPILLYIHYTYNSSTGWLLYILCQITTKSMAIYLYNPKSLRPSRQINRWLLVNLWHGYRSILYIYFSQKQLPRKTKPRLVVINCAGYVFWQLFLWEVYIERVLLNICTLYIHYTYRAIKSYII